MRFVSAKARMCYPAANRNREPILEVLREALIHPGVVLEIASGTGQHAVHMARHLPHIQWQPSDCSSEALASIAEWQREAQLKNLQAPVALDACSDHWGFESPPKPIAIVCCNMVHIAPWRATLGLIAGAGRCLDPGGLLFLYGPYMVDGTYNASSNADFDHSWRARNPEWGLRELTEIQRLAAEVDLVYERIVDMPANNYCVLFRKTE